MWGVAMDVAGWLRGLGLEQYEANFRDNKVDAAILPQLTADDLKDIGVVAVGDRRKLLAAIAAWAGAIPAEGAAPTPSSSRGGQVSAERRPITVMFCDLVGSTTIAAKLDAEDWRDLVNAYLDEASSSVTGFGGYVLKRLGDGLMALFGYPQAQENDAERAVRAALAIPHGARYQVMSGSPAERAEARNAHVKRLRRLLEGPAARLHPRPGRTLDRRGALELSLRRALMAEREGLLR
jgi:hypothetical protein